MKRHLSFIPVFLLAPTFLIAQIGKNEPEATFKINSNVLAYPDVQWIKGDPIIKFDEGKTYVIECWATWCAPCIEGIPRINELGEKFKDSIIFIGQSVWEEDKAKVEKFVTEKGEKMNYRIAFSGGDSSDFVTQWLKAANLTAIPVTFVVQDRKLVWITHPASLTEHNLRLLLKKQFSIAEAERMSPFKKLQDARVLLAAEELIGAGQKIDSALLEYPDFSVGVYLKIKLLKKQGKTHEAIAYARTLFERKQEEGRLIYYDELMEAKKYSVLIPLLDSDITKKPHDVEAIMLRYTIYIVNKDYHSAATIVNNASNSSKDLSELTQLALIDKYTMDSIPHPDTDQAILKAGQKVLSVDPGHYNVALSVAQRLWHTNKNEASQVLRKAIEAPKENEKLKKYDKILERVLASMAEGSFPTDELLSEWREDIFKD